MPVAPQTSTHTEAHSRHVIHVSKHAWIFLGPYLRCPAHTKRNKPPKMWFNSFLHHQCYGWQPNKIGKIILIPGAYCLIMGRHFQDFSPFNNVEGYLLSPPIQCRNIKFWVEGWLCNVVQQSQWGRWWWDPFWEGEAVWECRQCQSKCWKKAKLKPRKAVGIVPWLPMIMAWYCYDNGQW